MTETPKHPLRRMLISLAIWFLVVTFVVLIYAKGDDPMPLSVLSRLGIAAAIVAFVNIPLIRRIGHIYLHTTPDDGDLDN
ncbi:hypothetical protein DSM110093_00641 [Sulfitobacter sp. DSM 110093]|uniref:hypothetical protein n=1 Tax=Sulfitobacter sp. DSM 110093 TaxID=2883127 RepID=UPI001FACEA64|nr:hypothetical protein [Sulfitobacter sp. DSM 110093]UOA30881.1 hypothetical protein DSM110093_00641 [Sulfitobacter sp. DSM 110093]